MTKIVRPGQVPQRGRKNEELTALCIMIAAFAFLGGFTAVTLLMWIQIIF